MSALQKRTISESLQARCVGEGEIARNATGGYQRKRRDCSGRSGSLGDVVTIGIAAVGPNAGHAIMEALHAVEKIGSGAIGGFVSFVAIDSDGRLVRMETQAGGVRSILAKGLPSGLATARMAALMSSGPNRPAPLSQFTPADPQVALLTGHRLPNTLIPGGLALNELVLERIRAGQDVETALSDVMAQHSGIDAGVIALTVEGRIALADTEYVARFFDAGSALITSDFDPAIKVAVMHNAIQPWRGLAMVAAQTALNVMDPPDSFDHRIKLKRGQIVRHGDSNIITENQGDIAILIENADFLHGGLISGSVQEFRWCGME